jgi:hypothetical protein
MKDQGMGWWGKNKAQDNSRRDKVPAVIVEYERPKKNALISNLSRSRLGPAVVRLRTSPPRKLRLSLTTRLVRSRLCGPDVTLLPVRLTSRLHNLHESISLRSYSLQYNIVSFFTALLL